MNATVQEALNEQIKNELYSAYLYLSMAAYLESVNFKGFAHWMRVQHDEETTHAMKFFDYVYDRGGRVTLKPIDQPPAEFASVVDVYEKTLEHEQYVTSLINKLLATAAEQQDPATQAFLQWFVTEQVEEEKNATELLARLKIAGERGSSLLWLDKEASKR